MIVSSIEIYGKEYDLIRPFVFTPTEEGWTCDELSLCIANVYDLAREVGYLYEDLLDGLCDLPYKEILLERVAVRLV